MAPSFPQGHSVGGMMWDAPRRAGAIGLGLPPSAQDRADAESPIILSGVRVQGPPLEPKLGGKGHRPPNASIWPGDEPAGRVSHAELPGGGGPRRAGRRSSKGPRGA